MKKKIFLLLAASICLIGWAQTNSTPPKSVEQEIGIHAARYELAAKLPQMIYSGHVTVTNFQGTLTCEQLTIDLPPEGSTNKMPGRAVAETNVVIDFITKGKTNLVTHEVSADATNHITCDKAIYAYSVVNAVTNQTITFTGNAKMKRGDNWITGEPLVWDNIAEKFTAEQSGTYITPPPKSDKGTNASTLDILK